MHNDMEIRRDVEAELDWDARLDSRQIGVAVKNGVVSLTGHVSSFAERNAAEEAAQRVSGVRAIANDILVELSFDKTLTDAEVAENAVAALKSNVAIPSDMITLLVKDGWINLRGQVSYWYQKNAALNAVANLRGVRGVTNGITIVCKTTPSDVTSRIEDAFRRQARIDADKIRVQVTDGVVTLEGDVASYQERQQAASAAWQAPGVSQVIDKLTVRPSPPR
jgi:osmotically-inducible protein OsmY